ncbi:TPA: DUF551 domain-containing protein [Klebsiella pneumoniae]|uniref:DUF551 domain-containing protein n=1 Tax=Klebsiella pneumoniae TaxID=573 RepID=UPI000E2B4B58|nr:DUF551 domain-containing protein [Klebsiella pneumoniae]MCD9720955.1 DUF551 domain-containing protein [Klebsiella pneumoniae]SXT02084.1 Protein of uncharacterised function (DUF551) [Klebsiella pneumoniae]SYA20155.1 Protein of uncharacterised function (DUF551) [Klebsiella pneumoniae]HCB0996456.1 DUF551 domain-containing protein [Klebsiella pneumoniae]
MTKSTITRERLAKIKSWRETYGAGSNVMLPAEEAEELARIALAAMNGEPVAEVLSNRPGNDTSTIDRALPVGTQLYLHAQPEPVVPDAATAIRACLSEFPESARDIVEECADIAENACRAAMLQELQKSAGAEATCRSNENVQVLHTKSPAQSDCCPAQNGDTPAQSQGWIPVSERMPDVGDIVLTAMGGSVNVGEMERSGANYRYFTSVISGRELPVTHWMPLPAAPQEVK